MNKQYVGMPPFWDMLVRFIRGFAISLARTRIESIFQEQPRDRHPYRTSKRIIRAYYEGAKLPGHVSMVVGQIMESLQDFCEGKKSTGERMRKADLFARVFNEVLIGYAATRKRCFVRGMAEREVHRLILLHAECFRWFSESSGTTHVDSVSYQEFRVNFFNAMGIKVI